MEHSTWGDDSRSYGQIIPQPITKFGDLQKPVASSYHAPDTAKTHAQPIYLTSTLILPSHLYLGLSSGVFPSRLLYNPTISSFLIW